MLQNIQYTYITERRTQDISGKRIAIACEDLHSFPIIFIEMGKGYLRQEDGFYHVFLFFFLTWKVVKFIFLMIQAKT